MNVYRFLALFCVVLLPVAASAQAQQPTNPPLAQAVAPPALGDYVVLGWNDLGMHCMNGDFSSLCILPPFNDLWAQVVHRGDNPQVVTTGVNLTYRFPNNSTSANKVNFWTYAKAIFNVNLAPNVGLAGNGMTGSLTWNGHAFEAIGVPLTPFEDATPTTEQPYQFAEVTARDAASGAQLDQTTFVAPVSVEVHCDLCHSGGGRSVYDNILARHDEEEGTHLLNSKPVLCANCHGSNALGMAGNPNLPNLSQALHGKHAEERPDISCYNCHPGQQTQCLRDAMYQAGKKCQDCHGSIAQVASSIGNGRRPWMDEPKCGTCHPDHTENANTLYRNSTGHGGLYCTACHNSPHAVLPTVQPRDMVQALRVQGKATYIKNCLVCHKTQPLGAGPHGVLTSWRIAQHLAAKSLLTTDQLSIADYNHDGKVDVADVIWQVRRGL